MHRANIPPGGHPRLCGPCLSLARCLDSGSNSLRRPRRPSLQRPAMSRSWRPPTLSSSAKSSPFRTAATLTSSSSSSWSRCRVSHVVRWGRGTALQRVFVLPRPCGGGLGSAWQWGFVPSAAAASAGGGGGGLQGLGGMDTAQPCLGPAVGPWREKHPLHTARAVNHRNNW